MLLCTVLCAVASALSLLWLKNRGKKILANL